MTLQVETSIGVALHPEHTDSVPRLLQLADVAMYQAKEERTGVELYRPERDIHTPDRLDLLGSVRRAIENGELEMHFQPTVVVARRAAGRRRGAGPLEPPGARADLPGRLPRPGRAVRPDAPAHPPRARQVAGPGGPVVARRHRGPGRRQRVGPRPIRREVRRRRGRPAARARPAGAGPQAGDHRARADGRPGPDDRTRWSRWGASASTSAWTTSAPATRPWCT